jgi:hypothetical protein
VPVKKRLQSLTRKINSKLKVGHLLGPLSNRSSASELGSRSIEWIYLLVIFLLASGIINAASNAGLAGINTEAIVPNATVQNAIETFILLFTYILGSLGAYSLYISGKQTVRARSSEMFFTFGLVLVAFSIYLGYYVLTQKGLAP